MRSAASIVALLLAVLASGPAAHAGGADTVGLVDVSQGQWHLTDVDGDVSSFVFGNPGDIPIVGDWDCDGTSTPGMYRPSDGYVYLRDSNRTGIANHAYYFGDPGDVPLSGDFDGDGCDTVSVYRPAVSTVYVINQLGSADGGLGAADHEFVFGNSGDTPFVGDFDGDGVDTVGLHRRSTGLVYLRQTNASGAADLAYVYGDAGDRLVAGDWAGTGIETPALFRPGEATFYLSGDHGSATAVREIRLGHGGMVPVAGGFGDFTSSPAVAAPSPTLAAGMAAIVNDFRAERGLAPLAVDSSVAGLAERRAWQLYQLGYLTHDLPGGSVGELLDRAGVRYWAASENMAAGSRVPAVIVRAWAASPGHYRNLAGEQYDRMGIGVADGPLGAYYVYVAVG